MAVTATPKGLTLRSEIDSKKYDEARRSRNSEDEDELTQEEQERYKILRYCADLLDDARKAREPFETFDMCWDLFIGNVWTDRRPPWRANITINKIRAFITFMQAVMTDNKPRLQVEPQVEGSEDAADLLRKLLDRDWDENEMQNKLSLFVQQGLIWGTGFMKITYDPFANGGRGKHIATNIPPSHIYANKTARCIEDAEYIIHREEMTMGWVRRNFPQKAEFVNKIRGVRMNDRPEREREHTQEGEHQPFRIQSAMSINGNIVQPQVGITQNAYPRDDGDTVEVMEFWIRDDSLEPYERQVVEHGMGKTKPVIKDGEYVMQVVGQKQVISEIDGELTYIPVRAPKMEPVMETAWRAKFPNGRLVVIAGGRVLLRDIPNPFQTDGFPFAMWKDYDVGTFWGQGEPLALKSCALAINKIASSVFEILEKTGNPSYKLKKDAGVNASTIKNKPGSIIVMDDIEGLKALDKPQPPQEYFELYKLVSDAMGEVSGVNEAMKGSMPAANTGFAAVDSLQESGSAPIRLKVRNMETGIARIGRLRIQLIQQFDQGQRPIRIQQNDDPNIVDPAQNVAVKFQKYTNADIQGQVEFGIVPISSLSTSPSSAWNKWLTLYDKKLVDRRWWHEHERLPGYKTELPRMEKTEEKQAMEQAAAKDKSKPGPAPKRPPGPAHRAKPAPPSNLPSRADNAAVR